MEKILILNGSPREPRSNSKQYAALFAKASRMDTEYRAITKTNHLELCRAAAECAQLLLVFPLYADCPPVTLLHFLHALAEHPPVEKPRVSVLINCGFLEPEQNDVSVEIVQAFCQANGYPFGSVLEIGGGEVILNTPFAFLVRRKIRKLASAMAAGRSRRLKVTMPITKKIYLWASTIYWENYGKRNGITRMQMETMEIEER